MTQPAQNPPEEFRYAATDNLQRVEAAMSCYNEWIIDKIIAGYGKTISAGARILDFGAGLGTLSQIFYEKSGIRPDAIETDPGHKDEMTRRGFSVYATLAELQSAYDLVYISNVLEHIEDDVGTLDFFKSHLKHDGVLVIYVPAFKALWTPMDDKVGHIRRYRKKDLANKLRVAGYSVTQIHYCDSLGFFVTLLFKLTGGGSGDLPIRSLYIYDRFLLPISRAMDLVCSRLFGKNLFVVAQPRG